MSTYSTSPDVTLQIKLPMSELKREANIAVTHPVHAENELL